MTKEDKKVELNDHAIAEYGDFEVYVKRAGITGREYSDKVAAVEAKYRRKNAAVKAGHISEEGAKKIDDLMRGDFAKLAAEYIVSGWKGKLKGKKLPEYSLAEGTKFFSEPDNQLFFIDVLEVASDAASFEKKLDEQEIKN